MNASDLEAWQPPPNQVAPFGPFWPRTFGEGLCKLHTPQSLRLDEGDEEPHLARIDGQFVEEEFLATEEQVEQVRDPPRHHPSSESPKMRLPANLGAGWFLRADCINLARFLI